MKLRSILRGLGRVVLGVILVAVMLVLVASYAPHMARDGVAALGRWASIGSKMLAPPLLAERRLEKCAWLEQNWSDEDRAWFHNVSQGTATFPVPYAWFRKLERPEISPLDPIIPRGLISDPDYLARLGFISPNKECDPPAGDHTAQGYGVLPIGFAVLKGGTDPATGANFQDGLGLTCAACHTGRVIYKGTELRIDGAPAMIDLQNLERIIGLSICYADKAPWRSGRFANSLLDDRPDVTGMAREAEKAATRHELREICDEKIFGKVGAEQAILTRRKMAHTDEGFGRLDALNRIGNQVFHENLADPRNPGKPAVGEMAGGLTDAAFDGNFAAHTAPVSFPPIWDVPNFVWAQYDASILNPNIRNIGEAMGVAAKINMIDVKDPARPLFSSTVDVAAINRVEKLLLGAKHPLDPQVGFSGLHAPKWAEAATYFPGDRNWDIDETEVVAGRGLYRKLCFECHRAPVRDSEIPIDDPDSFWMEENTDQINNLPEDKNWILLGNERLFNVVQKSVAVMGTDPEQARVLTERQLSLPGYLDIDPRRDVLLPCDMEGHAALRTSFVAGLMAAVRKVEDQWFLDMERLNGQAMPAEEVSAIKGMRPNCPNPRVFKPMLPEPNSHAAKITAGAPSVAYLVEPHYRARPLDGVWATAPYLHNGSVPTLDDLLTPQAVRPLAFCVGPVEFDPARVGLPVDRVPASEVFAVHPAAPAKPQCESGLTLFDTSERGNSNLGHSFEDPDEGADSPPRPLGVIGRGLKPDERANLIAYLKTL